MSTFKSDHAENMRNPEFAYEFGRQERELEIIKLAKEIERHTTHSELCYKEHRFVERLLAAIEGENK